MKKLSDTPSVHETARVTQSTLGRYTEVGAHCHVAYSTMGDYSYCVGGTQIAYATIGKFFKWWDWSHAELKEALPDFRALDAAAFAEKYDRVPSLLRAI